MSTKRVLQLADGSDALAADLAAGGFKITGLGELSVVAAANAATLLTLKRFTDTTPTGNFLLFQSAAAASLFAVDITGVVTTGTWQATTVSVGFGGTGQTSWTANSLLYASGTTTLASLGAATNGQIPIGSTGASPVLAALTAPAAGLTITSGAGSITFALANDLSGLEGLGTTGLAARTAADAWATRAITGTTNQVTVTNGDGVSGNPTLALPQSIHTGATPQFAALGLGEAAPAAGLELTGKTISTDADNTVGAADLTFSVTKNDTNARTFLGLLLKPTINTGASNASTTVNVLAVDTINTATTGVTTNLLKLSYGGAQKLLLDSAGALTLASALPVASGGTNSAAALSNGRVMISSGGAVVERAALTASALVVGDATNGIASVALGTANQVVGMNSGATANEYKTVTGTTNQVTVTHGAGSITLATPQNIHTASTPQFARLGLGAAADAVHLLLLSGGTVTADTHLFDGAVTWNDVAVTFTAFKANVTDTASAAASLLLDLQVGGASKLKVDKAGTLTLATALSVASGGTGLAVGTSGGVLGFTASGTLASSAALTANGVVLGGGAGATPTSTTAGTANQVLRVPGAGGAPAFGAIDLAQGAAVTGILAAANGGTANAFFAVAGPTTATKTITFPDANATVAVRADTLAVFAATTSAQLAGVISDETGSGALVFATSPTLVTPALGVATVTSINKVAVTAPATAATLTIAEGKTLTASNTLTLTGTDASSIAFGVGGTVAYTANNLSVFAATTSAQLAGVVSDETGSGALVFGTSPTITNPTTNGHRVAVAAKTGAYTLTTSDYFVTGDATTAGFTITLPAATGTGQRFAVKKTDSSTNAVTLSRAGTDLIDGVATKALSTQYQSITVVDTASGVWSVE